MLSGSVSLYLRLKKLNFKNNLHVLHVHNFHSARLSVNFYSATPRIPLCSWHPTLTVSGVLLTIAFSIMQGFIVTGHSPRGPRMAQRLQLVIMADWHSACSVFFLFNLFYNTMGIDPIFQADPLQSGLRNSLAAPFSCMPTVFSCLFLLSAF